MMTAVMALGACSEGAFEMPAFASRADSAPDAIAGGGTTAFIERDVEAPEVFQVTEAGLWDGRPSLGGIWVAHPDVGDPERVIIRNSDTGQFVIGALFRRERETPGPRLQVSSDAAEALGLLAGAPTQLNVTALRSEAQPAAATATPVALPTGDLEAPESVEITALESTSASLEPAPVAEVSAALAEPLTAAPIPPVSAAPVVTQTAQTPRTARVDPIASAAAALQAISAAVPAAAAAAPIETPTLAVADLVASAPVAAAAPIVTPAVATAPIAAPAPPAPAPAPEPVLAAASVPEVAPAPAPTPTRAPVTPAPSGDLTKPYLQVGIFSVEENAMNTADAMRSAGVNPILLEGQSQGRRFWRVIVGPAGSEADRAEMLQTVKAAGFEDAYAVTN